MLNKWKKDKYAPMLSTSYRVNTCTEAISLTFEQSTEPLIPNPSLEKKRFQVSGVFILYLVLFFHRLAQFSLTWALQLQIITILKVYENIFSQSTEYVFEALVSTATLISYGLGYLLAPLFGYIADAYWGRYKVILASFCLLFISLVGKIAFVVLSEIMCPQILSFHTYIPSLNTTFSFYSNFTCFSFNSTSESVPPSDYAMGVIAGMSLAFFFVVSSLSYSGVFANLCPFFVDQFEGCSEQVLTSLFHKFYWVSNLASLLAAVFVPASQYINFSFALLLAFVSNVTSIVLFVYFRKKFIVQPPYRPYPLSLIKKVVVNSFFRREDELSTKPTQKLVLCRPTKVLDRAKIANGGRFQVETVEDSKAFFRLITVFIAFIGMYYMQIQVYGSFPLQGFYLGLPDPAGIVQVVVTYSLITNGLLVFDPFAILIVQPILLWTIRKLGPWSPTLLQRMGVGYVFALLGVFSASLVDILRVAFPCRISILAQIPQYLLMGIAEAIGIVSEMEFTYAQSPYTMKGMLFGFMQLSRGIGIYLLAFVLLVIVKSSNCTRGDITDIIEGTNCTRIENPTCLYYTIGHSPNSVFFWLINFVFSFIGLPLFMFAAYRYSQRRRDYTD